METINKQTAAGEVKIEVSYTGCENVRALLNGKEIGLGTMPLPTPATVNGKQAVGRCGKLGLTAEDMAAIETALASEKSAYEASAAGIAAREESARWDRCCDRTEEIERNADINNLLRRHGQPTE
jgi:hypothetical protein